MNTMISAAKRNRYLTVACFMSLLLFGSCEATRNYHSGRIEPGFLKNKGEGNASFGADMEDNELGLNTNFTYAVTDHLAVQGGLSFYSSKFYPNYTVYDEVGPVNEDIKPLTKGTRLKLGLGYYSNFGRRKTSYIEVMGGVNAGAESFSFYDDNFNTIRKWDYNPFSAHLQFLVGKNFKNLSLAPGIRITSIWYGEKVPLSDENYYYNNTNDISYVKEMLYVEPFYAMRFGPGPVKVNFQVGFSISPFTNDLFDVYFAPKLSLGIGYVFGRKDPVIDPDME